VHADQERERDVALAAEDVTGNPHHVVCCPGGLAWRRAPTIEVSGLHEEDAMLNRHSRHLVSMIVPLFGLFMTIGAATAEDIAVGNYGSSANGMPFAVALAKGYFKEEGADVTGIVASQGGGTSVRNAMAGVAYGEANPGAIAVAIQQGADIKIVSDNVLTIAEFAWMVKKDSPIKTLKDLKGKKIGYTNPRSTSQALAVPAAEGRLQGRGCRAREDRRLRPDARRTRSRSDRRRRRDGAALVQGQGQVPRARHGGRSAAAARQRRRDGDG
jgi:hypothetical protein